MPNGEFSPERNTVRVSASTVAIAVAQQRDAIRTRHRAAGLFLKTFEEPAFETFRRVRPWGRVRFGDEHIAVGQHVEPARMVEPARKCRDCRACCGCRLSLSGPALRRDHVNDWNERCPRGRQDRSGTSARGNRQTRGRATSGRQRRDNGDHHEMMTGHTLMKTCKFSSQKCRGTSFALLIRAHSIVWRQT